MIQCGAMAGNARACCQIDVAWLSKELEICWLFMAIEPDRDRLQSTLVDCKWQVPLRIGPTHFLRQNATLTLDRMKALIKEQFVSQQDLDNAQVNFDAASAAGRTPRSRCRVPQGNSIPMCRFEGRPHAVG